MKNKLQTVNEQGDGFNERIVDCGDGAIGDQLMSFFAQSQPTTTTTPAAHPDGIKHRAPVDGEGCPIIDALPQTWDSNASTWGVVQWVDLDPAHFCQWVIGARPKAGWTATAAERFCRDTKGEGWGPPFFDAEIAPDIDWAIVAREFETCGLPTRLKNNS